MTPEEINIAIAGCCGWKIHDTPKWQDRYVVSPTGMQFAPADPRVKLTHFLPNYHGSLDAMHSA